MATTKGYKELILENLSKLDYITCRPMLGEYFLYYKDILFGGLYDNRLLIKKINSNQKYNLKEEIPYQNAKTMYLLEPTNEEIMKKIIFDTCKDLPRKGSHDRRKDI